MGTWFVGGEGSGLPPMQENELENMVRARRIVPSTPVRAHNMPNWMQAGQLPVFQQMFRRIGDEGAMGLLVPTGPQSGLAMAAGYLGLFSIFLFPAPLAILFGVLGLRDIARHPEKKGKGRAITGIVLGTLVTLGFLAVVVTAKKH